MPVYMDLGDIKGDATASADGDTGEFTIGAPPASTAADGKMETYLKIELTDVMVSSWQTSAAGAGLSQTGQDTPMVSDKTESSSTQVNPISWGLDRIDQSAPGGGGGTGKVSVHDISISTHVGGADNVEVILKVLDGGGPLHNATTDVGYTLTVTDTETGNVTERESGLVYSGESGGMNAGYDALGRLVSVTDAGAPAGDQLGKPKFEDIKLTIGVAGDDGDPGGLTTDVPVAEVKLPDVMVSSWQSSAGEAGAGSNPIGPFFAYDAGFRGGVDVPTASQGSGYAGQIEIASFNWSAETSAPEASGPMRESMETMKKAWKDASSDHAAGDDGFTGGVFVGASDAAPNGWLYLATDQGVYEHGVIGAGDLSDWQSNFGAGGSSAAPGDGGGTGKVSVHDISLSSSVIRADVSEESETGFVVTFDRPVDPASLSTDDFALWQSNYGTGSAAAFDPQFRGGITVAAGDLETSRDTFAFDGNTASAGRQATLDMFTARYCPGTESAADHPGGGSGDDVLIGGGFEGEADAVGKHWEMHEMLIVNQADLDATTPLSTFTGFDLV
jgi:hypothetical protein